MQLTALVISFVSLVHSLEWKNTSRTLQKMKPQVSIGNISYLCFLSHLLFHFLPSPSYPRLPLPSMIVHFSLSSQYIHDGWMGERVWTFILWCVLIDLDCFIENNYPSNTTLSASKLTGKCLTRILHEVGGGNSKSNSLIHNCSTSQKKKKIKAIFYHFPDWEVNLPPTDLISLESSPR